MKSFFLFGSTNVKLSSGCFIKIWKWFSVNLGGSSLKSLIFCIYYPVSCIYECRSCHVDSRMKIFPGNIIRFKNKDNSQGRGCWSMGVDEDLDVEGEEETKDLVRHSTNEGIHEWERELKEYQMNRIDFTTKMASMITELHITGYSETRHIWWINKRA